MKPSILIVFLTIILVTMIISLQSGPTWLVNRTYPIQLAATSGIRQVTGLGGWFADIKQLSEERDALTVERNQLLARVTMLEAELRQTEALRRQLAQSDDPDQPLVAARSAGLVTRGAVQLMLIDRGSDHGVEPGQVVVADGVAVGRIIDVDSRVSVIQLPQSHGSFIPVIIRYPDGQTAKGVVEGSYNLSARLQQVLPAERLEEGAVIVTSGEGGNYPPNLVIGKVGEVQAQESGFQSASIVLPWDVAKLETVFIIQPS